MSTQIADLKDERVPECLYWSTEDVSRWIEELGFPDYKECFETNFINGRRLICADASSLPKLGITDFKHMQTITSSVRDLLKLDAPFWNRSLSLPPREPLGLYLEQKSRTGETIDGKSYEDFLNSVVDAKWQPPLTNQGLLLPTK